MHDWQLPKVIWCARHSTVTVWIAVAQPLSQSASIEIGKHGVKHMAIAPKEICFFFICGLEIYKTIQPQKCPLGVWDTKKFDSSWKHLISHCTSFQCLGSNCKLSNCDSLAPSVETLPWPWTDVCDGGYGGYGPAEWRRALPSSCEAFWTQMSAEIMIH